jgi:LacI family transcriptional regulator
MEKSKVTIHDLASMLNLSASTVSRALSDHPRISKATRERVGAAAKELHFKPNHLASSFRKGSSRTIGIVVPRINRHFFSHAISGIESVTNPAGFNVMICQTNESFEEEKRSIQTLVNNRVDGIIMSIAVGTRSATHVKTAIDCGVPVVQFDRVNTQLETDKVLNDNFYGAYEATSHLIGQGYTYIVHAAGPLHNNVYSDRCEGFKKALLDAGLPFLPEQVIDTGLTRSDGEALARKLVSFKQLPQALFSASDYTALGTFTEFRRMGISIPGDIAIAGFANEPFTEFIEPSMTTLEQFGTEMGRSAARLLIERIENGGFVEVPRTITIKPQLIVRASTLAPTKAGVVQSIERNQYHYKQ